MEADGRQGSEPFQMILRGLRERMVVAGCLSSHAQQPHRIPPSPQTTPSPFHRISHLLDPTTKPPLPNTPLACSTDAYHIAAVQEGQATGDVQRDAAPQAVPGKLGGGPAQGSAQVALLHELCHQHCSLATLREVYISQLGSMPMCIPGDLVQAAALYAPTLQKKQNSIRRRRNRLAACKDSLL